MTAILITGMSGTGKSTIMGILKARGHSVAETDSDGWCVPADGDWTSPDKDWIWDEDRITSLLDKHEDTHLFIDGCRSNQGKFNGRFDHTVVFTAPIDVMLERVTMRSNNPFGQSAEDRAAITNDKDEIEPLLIRGADLVLDTSTTSPDSIADHLESLL